MAIYELVLTGRYFAQTIINRWNYVSNDAEGTVNGSFALISAFGAIPNPSGSTTFPDGGVFDLIRDMVNIGVTFEQIYSANLYVPADFYETPFPSGVTGGDTGEGLSPTAAYGFRTNRVTRAVARGTKRFVGVSEPRVGSGGVMLPAWVDSNMQPLADAMSEILTYDDEGVTHSFNPAVCGKQRYNPETGLPDAEGTAYRYYPTLAEQTAHTAVGVTWSPYTTQRTQASRQYGNGY